MAHTKADQGAGSCYARAKDDEPIFVLLARDPVAWLVVMQWAGLRQALGKTEPAQIADAEECARAMAAYCDGLGKAAERNVAHAAFFELYKQWQADARTKTMSAELVALRLKNQEQHTKLGQAELLLDAVVAAASGTDAQLAELGKNESFMTSDAVQEVVSLRRACIAQLATIAQYEDRASGEPVLTVEDSGL